MWGVVSLEVSCGVFVMVRYLLSNGIPKLLILVKYHLVSFVEWVCNAGLPNAERGKLTSLIHRLREHIET